MWPSRKPREHRRGAGGREGGGSQQTALSVPTSPEENGQSPGYGGARTALSAALPAPTSDALEVGAGDLTTQTSPGRPHSGAGMTQHLLSTHTHISCHPAGPQQAAGRGQSDWAPELSLMLAKAAQPTHPAGTTQLPALSLSASPQRVWFPPASVPRIPCQRGVSKTPSSKAWGIFVGRDRRGSP